MTRLRAGRQGNALSPQRHFAALKSRSVTMKAGYNTLMSNSTAISGRSSSTRFAVVVVQGRPFDVAQGCPPWRSRGERLAAVGERRFGARRCQPQWSNRWYNGGRAKL